ncbi:MAG: four helix bundle protein [Bacteroidota bacterium]|nr:four helix bundle protein [Bacteroidota bacterium]
MATISNFEDLEIWQKARNICKMVYAFSQKPDFFENTPLRHQILRSSGSIMDNIAEGFEREGSKELIYFLSIAKGSCGECRSQTYRALDQNNISQIEFNELYKMLAVESKQINKFISYLKESKIKGNKFK